jgi:hypothetical protein
MDGGRNWSHGVEVRRRGGNGVGKPRAAEVLIRRICLRYEDGRRACFVPEAGEEFFSRDDVHRVVGFLHEGSEALEWGPALEEQPGTERVPGEGPYDTGAV